MRDGGSVRYHILYWEGAAGRGVRFATRQGHRGTPSLCSQDPTATRFRPEIASFSCLSPGMAIEYSLADFRQCCRIREAPCNEVLCVTEQTVVGTAIRAHRGESTAGVSVTEFPTAQMGVGRRATVSIALPRATSGPAHSSPAFVRWLTIAVVCRSLWRWTRPVSSLPASVLIALSFQLLRRRSWRLSSSSEAHTASAQKSGGSCSVLARNRRHTACTWTWCGFDSLAASSTVRSLSETFWPA